MDVLEHAVDLVSLADVGLDALGGDAVGLQLCHKGLGGGLRVVVVDPDPIAKGGKVPIDALADALGGTGDEDISHERKRSTMTAAYWA